MTDESSRLRALVRLYARSRHIDAAQQTLECTALRQCVQALRERAHTLGYTDCTLDHSAVQCDNSDESSTDGSRIVGEHYELHVTLRPVPSDARMEPLRVSLTDALLQWAERKFSHHAAVHARSAIVDVRCTYDAVHACVNAVVAVNLHTVLQTRTRSRKRVRVDAPPDAEPPKKRRAALDSAAPALIARLYAAHSDLFEFNT